MSKVGVKVVPPTATEGKLPKTTTDNTSSGSGLNGLVNGEKTTTSTGAIKKVLRSTSNSKSETVTGTKPKKKNRHKQKTNNEEGGVEVVEELTKSEICAILDRCSRTDSEPVASDNTTTVETLIDDLKELNLDTELSDIACCATETSEQQQQQTQQEGDTKVVEREVKELPPVEYVQYESELQMPMIMKLIQKDLSEPYSIYTYRYFIHNWPKLCFLVGGHGFLLGIFLLNAFVSCWHNGGALGWTSRGQTFTIYLKNIIGTLEKN